MKGQQEEGLCFCRCQKNGLYQQHIALRQHEKKTEPLKYSSLSNLYFQYSYTVFVATRRGRDETEVFKQQEDKPKASLANSPGKTNCLIYTFGVDVPEVIPLFRLFPRSICTETLAWDRFTPALCNACAKAFKSLATTKTNLLTANTLAPEPIRLCKK